MFSYNTKAITYKNINKFDYTLYASIAINQMQYYNDSSAAIRVLDSVATCFRELADNIPYLSIFTMGMKNFKQIDRINSFRLLDLDGLNIESLAGDVLCYSNIIGYSKYTNREYLLEYVDNKEDFVRHSYPCDLIFTKKVAANLPKSVSLIPNQKTPLDLIVHSSAITLRPMGPMSESTIGELSTIIFEIKGVDFNGDIRTEEISCNLWTDYMTRTEWTYIESIKMINSTVAFDLIVYPYKNCQSIFWDKIYTAREDLDRYYSVISFDKDKKRLEFKFINSEAVDFPLPVQLFKAVYINGIAGEISDYYIDQDNGLFYAIEGPNLYCYPFIIPIERSPYLDTKKTAYQSFKIEYEEDLDNNKFIFDLYPTAISSGLDELDIYLDGILYKQGILIDLIKEKMIDNRIEIPHEDLFTGRDKCMVEFITDGLQRSVNPILVSKTVLDPLYIKDCSEVLTIVEGSYLEPLEFSTDIDYTGPLSIDNPTRVYKLSKFGGIVVDGYVSEEVFKTFYYVDGSVITHDSISGLKVE